MHDDPALLDELARVFAVAAVESALAKESRRYPDKERGGLEEKDGKAKNTRSFSTAPQ